MHLVTLRTLTGPALGVLADGEASTDVFVLADLDPGLPATMTDLLGGGPDGWAAVRRAVAGAGRASARARADLPLLAPVPAPGRVFGVGLNYRDHVAEAGRVEPTHPTVFVKLSSSVTGPDHPIAYPAVSTRVDYEGELGVVIGTAGRDVPEDRALDLVAGYLNVNDVSARDWQGRTTQWTLGKSFDTFTPIGPALVTRDEVPDPQGLAVVVTVNGEVRQDAHSSQMIFPVTRLIAEISAVTTLMPGDIIATGTPAGVGIGFQPERLLQIGDEVTVHFAGLGTLRNTVAPAT